MAYDRRCKRVDLFMIIVEEASRLLTQHGYDVMPEQELLRFEDTVVLGFVRCFEDVASLVEGWRSTEERFLRKYSDALRRDGRKSWNVYSILITSEQASRSQELELLRIEEDFVSTRKVARAGVATDRDVDMALAVLLPIRSRVSLGGEDPQGLLVERLSTLPEKVIPMLLSGVPGELLAGQLIQEEHES